METKFTPGPWKIDPMTPLHILQEGTERGVASISHFSNVDVEKTYAANIANARLIAAAPEMYEALSRISHRAPVMGSVGEYREGQQDALDTCREIAAAALAHARGET